LAAHKPDHRTAIRAQLTRHQAGCQVSARFAGSSGKCAVAMSWKPTTRRRLPRIWSSWFYFCTLRSRVTLDRGSPWIMFIGLVSMERRLSVSQTVEGWPSGRETNRRKVHSEYRLREEISFP